MGTKYSGGVLRARSVLWGDCMSLKGTFTFLSSSMGWAPCRTKCMMEMNGNGHSTPLKPGSTMAAPGKQLFCACYSPVSRRVHI